MLKRNKTKTVLSMIIFIAFGISALGSGDSGTKTSRPKTESEIARDRERRRESEAETRRIRACERYAKLSATHPSTVEFSWFWDLSTGRSGTGYYVRSKFSCKNAFGLKVKYNIHCEFDSQSNLKNANVWESLD